MKFFTNSKSLRIVALFIALLSPFAFFSSQLKPTMSRLSPLNAFQEIVYPLQYAWESVNSTVSLHWQRLFELNSASIENISLKREIAGLKLSQLRYNELEQENDTLKELIGLQKSRHNTSAAVEIFGRNRHDVFQSLRINKGSLDDLDVGMPLISADGVIGKLIRVGLKHSDVQILTDANFYLDVIIQRTRTRAILQGTGDGHCQLRIRNRSQVKIGDTVVTSGIVGSFPKGIPVGIISKISYGHDYVSQNIEIEPWVKTENQEYALVLKFPDQDIERIVESTSKNWLNKTTSIGSKKGG
ncbi:rod shape-determining protein MreC [Oligoflexaceae bacterium]|nr:rod shape-determining protein MreC [Oligoflexaceae bacterium]